MVTVRKFMLIAVTTFLVVVLMSASASWVSAQSESTLDKILKTKKLRVVCILTTPPFGMRDSQGNPIGYDVDIAHELAKNLGVDVEIVDSVDAANRVPYIVTDKADVAIATLGITLERAKVINYTDPYVRDGQVIVTRSDLAGIDKLQDLEGKMVGVVRGGPQDIIVDKYLKHAKVMRYGSVADVFLALRQKKVDAVIESKVISDYQASLSPGIKVVGDPFTTLYWGFGVRKGDVDWLNYLNIFIRELSISGKNEELYGKWFGGARPPKLLPEY